uniref:Uncharacterized protein n=1 Tax=Ascaris lumbricoides TaxID=6252 RepID=A0A0M3HJ67_ASCLU
MANPYVEAFLQLGTNIPCQSDSARRIANICTNITRNNWCPESVNTKLREMLKGKKTWFVDFSENLFMRLYCGYRRCYATWISISDYNELRV